MSAPRTSASDSSSWPTANTHPDNTRPNKKGGVRLGEVAAGMWPTATAEDAESSHARRVGDVTLTEATELWRTPAASEPGINPERLVGGDGHRAYDLETGRLAQYGITQQAEMWATPMEDDASNVSRTSGQQASLVRDAMNWPSPQAHDAANERTPEQIAAMRSRGHGAANLNETASYWATPAARDWKGDYSDEALTRQDGKSRENDALPQQVSRLSFLPGQGGATLGDTSLSDGPASHPPSKRKLNPIFVSWLMGWPIWWPLPYTIDELRLESPETALSLYRQLLRSTFLDAASSTN